MIETIFLLGLIVPDTTLQQIDSLDKKINLPEYFNGLKVENYESEAGSFNYLEDAIEVFGENKEIKL